MNDLRKTTGESRLALKSAVRRSVLMAGGGDSVEYATRVDASSLSRYGSPKAEHEKNHCPIDVAVDLDLEAGQPVILAAMAKAQGFELVPVVEVSHSDIPWEAKLCRMGVSRGELFGVIGAALSDGRFDAEEAGRADAKIEEEIAELRRLQARIQSEGGQGGNVVPVRKTGSART